MRPASSYPHCDPHVAFTPRRPPSDPVLRIALDLIVSTIVVIVCLGGYVAWNGPGSVGAAPTIFAVR